MMDLADPAELRELVWRQEPEQRVALQEARYQGPGLASALFCLVRVEL